MTREVRLRKVVRYATDEDIKKIEELDAKEENALRIATAKIKEHELPIRMINLEYLFDISKLHFYYRVTDQKKTLNIKDFTKDLATSLNAKVEMHLVSPRDEAKLIGGLGNCGRSLCCASWLDRPRHVTVKSLKEQGLSINPTKTSGVCGRLMCCLQYELDGKPEKER
jgi:cell fate regulator YaaT (PSP1 superfamily)